MSKRARSASFSDEEEDDAGERSRPREIQSTFDPFGRLRGVALGIHSTSDAGITVPEIVNEDYVPSDGFIHHRNTGALLIGQHGKQPFNRDERELTDLLMQRLLAHADYAFVDQCVGASTRELTDFLALKDVVRDRVVADVLKRARDVQQERLKVAMPARLASRDAMQARYLRLNHIEGVIDAEVRGPARRWVDTDASAIGMALWTRILGREGDVDEFHALLFPFYMRWQYAFVATRIAHAAAGPLTPLDRDTMARIIAMDQALFPDIVPYAVVGDADAPALADDTARRRAFLAYVLGRDVYQRHNLGVGGRRTRLTNRQWLDGVLVDTLRRGMLAVPGFVDPTLLPYQGVSTRVVPAFNLVANPSDVQLERFLDALVLFNESGDDAAERGNLELKWTMNMSSAVPVVPAWFPRVLRGAHPTRLDPADPSDADAMDDADVFGMPVLLGASLDDLRTLANATILFNDNYGSIGSTNRRLFAHAVAPSLLEWTRASVWLERMLSPVVVAALTDMAQQPRWREDHGLVVLPRLEADAARAFSPEPSMYYLQWYLNDAVAARASAIGDVIEYVHVLTPLLVQPREGLIYANVTEPAINVSTYRNRLVTTLNGHRGSLAYYRRSTWGAAVNNARTAVGIVADDAQREVANVAIHPFMVRYKLLPYLFGGASVLLRDHISRQGHWFQVGGVLEPFAPRATAGPPAEGAPGTSADAVWPEVMRTLHRLAPAESHVTSAQVARAAAHLDAGNDPFGTMPSAFALWPDATLRDPQIEATPLIALPLYWHYVRLLYAEAETRYRAADLASARKLVNDIDMEIAQTQAAATKAATDSLGGSSSDIIQLAQNLYVADPATMAQPHISGRVLFTPFFRRALDDLRVMVQVTLGYGASVGLDTLTSNEDRHANLRHAAVTFIAAKAAQSGIFFPSGYNKDRQFGVAPQLLAEAIGELRKALVSYGRPVVRGPVPWRLHFR